MLVPKMKCLQEVHDDANGVATFYGVGKAVLKRMLFNVSIRLSAWLGRTQNDCSVAPEWRRNVYHGLVAVSQMQHIRRYVNKLWPGPPPPALYDLLQTKGDTSFNTAALAEALRLPQSLIQGYQTVAARLNLRARWKKCPVDVGTLYIHVNPTRAKISKIRVTNGRGGRPSGLPACETGACPASRKYPDKLFCHHVIAFVTRDGDPGDNWADHLRAHILDHPAVLQQRPNAGRKRRMAASENTEHVIVVHPDVWPDGDGGGGVRIGNAQVTQVEPMPIEGHGDEGFGTANSQPARSHVQPTLAQPSLTNAGTTNSEVVQSTLAQPSLGDGDGGVLDGEAQHAPKRARKTRQSNKPQQRRRVVQDSPPQHSPPRSRVVVQSPPLIQERNVTEVFDCMFPPLLSQQSHPPPPLLSQPSDLDIFAAAQSEEEDFHTSATQPVTDTVPQPPAAVTCIRRRPVPTEGLWLADNFRASVGAIKSVSFAVDPRKWMETLTPFLLVKWGDHSLAAEGLDWNSALSCASCRNPLGRNPEAKNSDPSHLVLATKLSHYVYKDAKGDPLPPGDITQPEPWHNTEEMERVAFTFLSARKAHGHRLSLLCPFYQ